MIAEQISALGGLATNMFATMPNPAIANTSGSTGYSGARYGRGASGRVRRNTSSATPASAKNTQSANTA